MLNLIKRATSGAVNGSRNTEQLLGKLPIFSRLDARQIRKLARVASPRRYSKAQVIINKGDMGLGLYAIVSGKVEIFDQNDGKNIVLGMAEAGDCVGEMSLIDEQPRSAHVRVVEDTECLILTRENFNRLVKRDPDILRGIVPLIVQRLRQINKRLAELSVQGGAHQAASEPVTPLAIPAHQPESVPPAAAVEVPQIEPEAVAVELEGGVISSVLKLSSASLMLFSSVLLFNTQEALRLVAGEGSLSQRLGGSQAALSALTTRVKESMSEPTQRVFSSFSGILGSINSFLDL